MRILTKFDKNLNTYYVVETQYQENAESHVVEVTQNWLHLNGVSLSRDTYAIVQVTKSGGVYFTELVKIVFILKALLDLLKKEKVA